MSNCYCGTELTWENTLVCVKCGIEICEDCGIPNKFKCEKCADKSKIKIPDVIRRSSIEDYKSCPYYFKLHVIDGNQPKQNIMARLGSDLHDMYENIQRGEISVDEIETHTEQILKDIELEYGEGCDTRIYDRANVCNQNFIKLLPKLVNKAVAFEERINFSIGKDLPKVTIAYDRLEEDENGDLHIVDWKTGKVMSGKKLTTDLQIKFSKQLFWSNSKKTILTIEIVGAIIIAIVLGLYIEKWWLAVLCVVIMIGLPLLLKYSLNVATKKSLSDTGTDTALFEATMDYHFNEKGMNVTIFMNGLSNSFSYGYDRFIEVVETKDLFVFIIENNQAFYVEKDGFYEGNIIEFSKHLSTLVGYKKI